jgi:hypothetical protein
MDSMNPETLRGVNEILKGKLDYVEGHRGQPTLMAQRLEAYMPLTGAEDCPQCWLHDGLHTRLVLEEQSEGVDLLSCPCCQFSEFVVSIQTAPRLAASETCAC